MTSSWVGQGRPGGLTSGFDQGMGFDYLSIPGTRWNAVPWPRGRAETASPTSSGWGNKGILQNVVTRKVEQRLS